MSPLLGMLILSVPWAALGWAIARWWTLLLPVAFWVAFAWLEDIGLLTGDTSLGAALGAGAVGSICAGFGILTSTRRRVRPA